MTQPCPAGPNCSVCRAQRRQHEGTPGWRAGIEASIRSIDRQLGIMPDLMKPAARQALLDAKTHLEAMLSRGTEHSLSELMGVSEPTFVAEWREFLLAVEVRGPIPIVFDVVRWQRNGLDEWLLRWVMGVPDRVTGKIEPVTFQNKLPDARTTALKRKVIRQCVLGAFQHEALESIFVAGERAFDPHKERWYSNLVADWRFVP